MAKKDNNVDQTPIEFYIPPSGSGIRKLGSRVPVPINQPHWKYKIYNHTRPTMVEWILVIFFALVIFAMGISVLFSSILVLPKLIISLGLISVSSGIVNHMFWREKNHKTDYEEVQAEKQSGKKEKKQPKRRKDYK